MGGIADWASGLSESEVKALIDTLAELNAIVTDATLDDSSSPRPPSSHSGTHQHGGGDEIATATPSANAIPKASAGGKLTSWIDAATTTISGIVRRATQAEVNAGTDTTKHLTPATFAAAALYLADVIVRKIRTTTGPTDLTVGAIADGELLKRVGSTIVGGTAASTPTGPAGGDLAGTYPNPTVAQASNSFALAGSITPPSLSTSQNDYNPGGLANAVHIHQGATANVNITGLAGGAAGRLIALHNTASAFAITLTNEDSSSSAANRFAMGANQIIGPGAMVLLQYVAATSRWALVGAAPNVAAGTGKVKFEAVIPSAPASKGDFGVDAIGNNGSTYMTARAPGDLTRLISARIACIPNSTLTTTTGTVRINVDYAAPGETFNTHSAADTTSTYSMTADQMKTIDITALVGSLAAGDYLGVRYEHLGAGFTNNVLGIVLVYV